jgi:CRISPR/Cas system-associated exonuclease Cas4 (RecB family)
MDDLHVMREGLHVSVSQIKTYLRCPRQFWFRYVTGAQPEGTPWALLFGAAFHAALATLYNAVKDAKALPPLVQLVEAFTKNWEHNRSRTVLVNNEVEGAPATQAAKMLGLAVGLMRLRPLPVVVAVEQPFQVELVNPATGEVLEEKLVGAFDLVLEENGRKVIVEHKTAARRYSAEQLQHDIQGTAYKMAAKDLGMGDVDLRMQVFTKATTPTIQVENVQRGKQDERDLLQTVNSVLTAVDAGVFHPTPGWQCNGCQFRMQCQGGPP